MFDTAVMARRSERDVARKLLALPAALAAHALVLGALVFGQLWTVGAVQECAFVPPLIVHIPPPVGGGDHAKDGATTKSRGTAKHAVQTQPVRVPPTAPDVTPADRSPSLPEVPGSVGPGGGEGRYTGAGVGEGPDAPGATDGPSIEVPKRIGGDVRAPVAIVHPAPPYPELARRMRVEGVVIVEAVIDRFGNVVEAHLRHDPGFGCGEAALQAIQGWKYKPATLDGRPVSVFLEVTVTFRLHGGA